MKKTPSPRSIPTHRTSARPARSAATGAVGLLAFALAFSGRASLAADAAEIADAYLGPCALVVSNDGQTLHVACADAQQVAWVELPGGSVTRRVPVPARPTAVAVTPDGKQLIVACAAPRSIVALMDAADGRILDTIPVGHTAAGMALSPDGSRLYVCNRFDNDISVIDLTAGRELRRVAAVREPISIAVTPDGQTVLVANYLPNARTNVSIVGSVSPVVTVIDSRTFETGQIELPSGSNSLRSLRVSPDGRHAFVTHLLSNFQEVPFRLETGWINTNVVSVIDVGQRKVVRTVGLDEFDLGTGNPWDLIFSADGQTVCVSIAGTHELCVIAYSDLMGDFARRTMQPMMSAWPIYTSLGATLWQRVSLPGKGPRGLAVAGTRVFAAEYFSDTVTEVDLRKTDDDRLRTFALGPPPRLTLQRRGELLFHDATICYQQWQSCASCHPDGRADGLTWDLMNDGSGNPKSTKSLLLGHKTPPAMALGVRPTSAGAVRSGLLNILFVQQPEDDAAAIDAYLESLAPVPSPHLVDGRLSPAALRGRQLFNDARVGCARCHPAPLYTDLKTHNVGSRGRSEYDDRFDTPTLVECWRTAPYLHDGRYVTIRQLLAEGRHGLRRGPNHDLTEQEINDLVEFVLSL